MADNYIRDAAGLWQPIERFRGVNLGCWFVLERWIAPSLFAGSSAVDEQGLCVHHGAAAQSLLRAFRRTWITEDDIARLAQAGLNAVRLPIGWWTLQASGPFVEDPGLLERAMRWCERHRLAVQLEVHGLPGGQSGEHHCGAAGLNRWLRDPGHEERSLDLIEELACRFDNCSALAAIGIANEPDQAIPAADLNRYALAATQRVRRHLGPEQCAVVVPAFTEHRLPELHAAVAPSLNVVTDVHYYQCFGDGWQALSADRHLQVPGRADELASHARRAPLVVGEWSLALPAALLAGSSDPAGLRRRFAAAQLTAYAPASGIYFWTYRTESSPDWSWCDAVANDWLPADLRAAVEIDAGLLAAAGAAS
jgi:glucan 1,3-beta-glucosidase